MDLEACCTIMYVSGGQDEEHVFLSDWSAGVYFSSVFIFMNGQWKMKQRLVLEVLPMDLTMKQGDEGLIFDAQTIQRMELLILSALNWRMRSITPFSFIYFFLSFIQFKDPTSKHSLKDRATEIIFKTHGGNS